jgi:tetratricopeptide (TPR) repeat protein
VTDPVAPAGEAYVAAIHDTIARLVALDVDAGGNTAARRAVAVLPDVLGRLRPGRHERRHARDLCAAAAELAEVAGWLLCDANRHAEADRANRVALSLSRRCGHRSMELFVLHNMSLQATYLRRPGRAVDLVRPVLDDGRLTGRAGSMRLHSMFRLRLARGYAQLGLRREAFDTLDHARSLLLDGVGDRDPAWSWWVSERGLYSATAAMHGTLGDWRAALGPLRRALEAAPPHAHRDRFLYLCTLLHAQLDVGDRREAGVTAEALAGLTGRVGSARPLARLMATVAGSPPRLRAAVEPLLHGAHRRSGRRENQMGRRPRGKTPAHRWDYISLTPGSTADREVNR